MELIAMGDAAQLRMSQSGKVHGGDQNLYP